ncbi:hypothetical protein V2J09_002232 [Rumex salicifolius]
MTSLLLSAKATPLIRALHTFFPSSIFPHVPYISIKAVPSIKSNSQPFFLTQLCIQTPISSAPKPEQAAKAFTIVTLLGFTPEYCICWKAFKASSNLPADLFPAIKTVQDTASLCGITSNIFWHSPICPPQDA